jgi:hypothetical protein
MSNKYQIIATVESFDIEKGGLKLKGVGKYCFEKEGGKEKDGEKGKEKKYWNIFENLDGITLPTFVEQGTIVKISNNNMGMQYLLSHAFTDKKGLKFELLKPDSEQQFSIVEVSHASK